MNTKNETSENNFNAISHKTDVMRGYDYFESVVEELKMNGFDVRVIKRGYKPLIEYDTIAGSIKYDCGYFDNYMKDYFRFIQIVGQKLSSYGLKSRLSLG